MKISLWSIGKTHEPFVKMGIEDFTARIGRYYPVEWRIFGAPRNSAALNVPQLMKKEAEMILEAIGADDYLILLDERGKQFTSEGLAAFIQQRANESARNLVFLIGGAFGVDAAVQQRANFKWSLSSLVFPHQLVRLILSEQIYRACTILRNEKYHHS